MPVKKSARAKKLVGQKRKKSSAQRRGPDFFVGGMPRSGTTSLCNYLSQHPDIFFSNPKEIEFFTTDFAREFVSHKKKNGQYPYQPDWPIGEDFYFSLFKDAGKKLAGEGSIWYLFSKEAAQNIAKYNKKAKLIFLIREPVEWLTSMHNINCNLLLEDEQVIEQALALEASRKKGKNIPKALAWPSRLFYSEQIKYANHIKRYYRSFPKKQVMIIIFDDFKNNPQQVYKEVLAFLGVKKFSLHEYRIVNKNKHIRFPRLYKLLMSPWVYPLINLLRRVMPLMAYKQVSEFAYARLTKKQERKPLSPARRKRLKKMFKPEVKKLSILLKRDLLTLWNY